MRLCSGSAWAAVFSSPLVDLRAQAVIWQVEFETGDFASGEPYRSQGLSKELWMEGQRRKVNEEELEQSIQKELETFLSLSPVVPL